MTRSYGLITTMYIYVQGRNFSEAMKAMAAVSPQFNLVPLKKKTCPKATVVGPHLHWQPNLA